MEMRRCMKGHYYDASIHLNCPYCNGRNTVHIIMSSGGGAVNISEQDDDERTLPLGYMQAASPQQMADIAYLKGSQTGESDDRTVALTHQNLGMDPVVGWLVCKEGKNRGQDYRLHADNNFIGGNENMDVYIKGDETISGKCQAVVSYSSINRIYYFTLLDAGSIVRLNGKVLLQTAQLQPYDEIAIGSTKFLFIPFCGEKFDWIESE